MNDKNRKLKLFNQKILDIIIVPLIVIALLLIAVYSLFSVPTEKTDIISLIFPSLPVLLMLVILFLAITLFKFMSRSERSIQLYRNRIRGILEKTQEFVAVQASHRSQRRHPKAATIVYTGARARGTALATLCISVGVLVYLVLSGAEGGTAIALAGGGTAVLWLDYFLLKLRVRRRYFGRNRAEAEELTGFLYDRYGKGDDGEPPPRAAWLPPETEEEATVAAGGKAHVHG